MTILDVRWFNGARGLIGIVRVEMDDDASEQPQKVIRYFVGPGSGLDAAHDSQEIADWGARFPEAAGEALFGRIDVDGLITALKIAKKKSGGGRKVVFVDSFHEPRQLPCFSCSRVALGQIGMNPVCEVCDPRGDRVPLTAETFEYWRKKLKLGGSQ